MDSKLAFSSSPASSPAAVLRGRVSAHPKGFGFVATESMEEFFIPPVLLRELVPGDIVEFKVEPGKKPGAQQVAAALVVERPETVWQGTLRYARGRWLLEPDEPCFAPLAVQGLDFAQEGVVVSVRVPAYKGAPRRGTPVHTTLERLLGERTRRGFDNDYALARGDFMPHFSEAALQQARSLVEPPDAAPCPAGRSDLRALAFVTIDGESTRDFDDAVFAQPLDEGWRVCVAIADVGYYVPESSALDREARARATSVYLPGKTVPMLPEELSNGVCSLVPGRDRFALVLDLVMSASGQVVQSNVQRAVIRSAQRLTYSQVDQWRTGGLQVAQTVQDSLQALWAVYEQLALQRQERGQLDFDSPEPKLVLSEDGEPRLEWVHRTHAHRLVEELMLLANMSVAKRLGANESALFRHQPSPEPEDWEQVVAWAATQGVALPAQPCMRALADFTGSVPAEAALKAELQARNGMRPAVYDSARASHFSLGYTAYTHFTSPIRRYPDLVVHRLLLGESNATSQQVTDVAQHCSERSRQARLAERFVWDKIKKRVMFRELGEGATAPAHVVSQSRRGVRAVVGAWQTSVVISSEDLLESGYRFDDEQDRWASPQEPLEPGSQLQLRLLRLVEDRARTEVHADVSSA